MLTLDVPVVFSQVGFLLGFELAARLLSLCSVGSFQWDFARLLFFPYTTCASSSAICDKCKAGYVLTHCFWRRIKIAGLENNCAEPGGPLRVLVEFVVLWRHGDEL